MKRECSFLIDAERENGERISNNILLLPQLGFGQETRWSKSMQNYPNESSAKFENSDGGLV